MFDKCVLAAINGPSTEKIRHPRILHDDAEMHFLVFLDRWFKGMCAYVYISLMICCLNDLLADYALKVFVFKFTIYLTMILYLYTHNIAFLDLCCLYMRTYYFVRCVHFCSELWKYCNFQN